jgi:two-component system phosphate regulon sensor histidine kinase PhoR
VPRSWKIYLASIITLLIAGTVVGSLYGYADRGLLVSSLLLLAWQVRQLLLFDKALRTRDFEAFGFGEGIWQQVFSRFSHQRSRSKKHKRRYRKLLKEMRDSANAMPDGGIVLNESFEIVFCNDAARELVGIRPKLDRNQRVDNILRDPRFIRYLSKGDFDDGVEIISPVHEYHWLSCRLVPYGAHQHLLMIRDVTERRRLGKMRRDFVAHASHELRTPLTVISGYLDSLAEDEDVPEQWQKPVGQMQSQAQRMKSVVTELLELSRLEGAGPVAMDQVVDVAALLSAARDVYDGARDTANIEVCLESSAGLYGIQSEIESVIMNLLANAVRHTPADGLITLAWQSDDEAATLSVTDTGEGIAEEHISRLTERFFRVDSARTRDSGGVGLGLAIVKHVLLRHDAELHINSKAGEGSRFSCRFPLERIATDI